MKQLIVIIGPNEVGKSTAAKEFVERYTRTAYVDSDWCRVMNPFEFTEIKKKTVLKNIYCVLHNYLFCDEIDTVVFTYSWHGSRKEIYDEIIEKLKKDNVVFKENIVILKCTMTEIIKRAREDGRDEVRIKRGIETTCNFYEKYDYPCIDTTDMTPLEVAEKIRNLA